MEQLSIRAAHADDVPLLASLEQETYGDEGYPAAFFYQALSQWPTLLLTAVDKRVQGYLLAAPGMADEVWIMSVLVAPTARGKGVGKTLLQHFLKHLDSSQRALLTVAPTNLAAISLYQQQGFDKLSYHTDFMGPGEDRLLMCYHAC